MIGTNNSCELGAHAKLYNPTLVIGCARKNIMAYHNIWKMPKLLQFYIQWNSQHFWALQIHASTISADVNWKASGIILINNPEDDVQQFQGAFLLKNMGNCILYFLVTINN